MRYLLPLLIVVAAPALHGRATAAPTDARFDARASEAIVRAVVARMGRGAVATVESIAVTATPVDGPVAATPAPDARSGRPSLFSLTVSTPGGPRRVGSAMATVSVEIDLLRATVALSRGIEITEDSVVTDRGIAAEVAFRPLPVLNEVVGARVSRPVEAGAVVTADTVVIQPAVKSGQQVRLRVVADGLIAYGLAVATEHGRIGQVIKVVNPDSRRTLSGRVTGPGEVEVMYGS